MTRNDVKWIEYYSELALAIFQGLMMGYSPNQIERMAIRENPDYNPRLIRKILGLAVRDLAKWENFGTSFK